MIQIRQWRGRWAFAESAKDSAIPSASAWGDHLASTLAQQSFQPRLQNNHSMPQDAIGHMQSEIPFGFYDLLWVANPAASEKDKALHWIDALAIDGTGATAPAKSSQVNPKS